MTSLNPPGDDILQSDGQRMYSISQFVRLWLNYFVYICKDLQVCTVTPVPEVPEVFQQKNAKEEITQLDSSCN